jgi:hypothetical protein
VVSRVTFPCTAGVVAAPSGLLSPARAFSPPAANGPLGPTAASPGTPIPPRPGASITAAADPAAEERLLTITAAALVLLPVFLQAPWVRQAPMAATLFTAVLLSLGLHLERQSQPRLSRLGALLVGFSGCWLGGSLFWGWGRLHPLWHLPVEGFALPLAAAGLGGRWRLAGSFYLASLLGTAATDAAMAFSGVIELWPQVLRAPLAQAAPLLHQAGLAVIRPATLVVVAGVATALLALCARLREFGLAGQVAAAALATTLAVDGIFLAAALFAPHLSGLL